MQRNIQANLGVGTLALDGGHCHARSMNEAKRIRLGGGIEQTGRGTWELVGEKWWHG